MVPEWTSVDLLRGRGQSKRCPRHNVPRPEGESHPERGLLRFESGWLGRDKQQI